MVRIRSVKKVRQGLKVARLFLGSEKYLYVHGLFQPDLCFFFWGGGYADQALVIKLHHHHHKFILLMIVITSSIFIDVPKLTRGSYGTDDRLYQMSHSAKIVSAIFYEHALAAILAV